MREDSAERKVPAARTMRAVRVHRFGGIEALVYEEMVRPTPKKGQVLVRVKAAGVGPWDAWVRAGKSAIDQPLPLVPGSDLSGVVEEIGADVYGFRPGEEIFGVTNARFTGAYAEYAVAEAGMIAPKPKRLSFVEAASVPVVASTAHQMVFDYGGVDASKRVLVLGGAGNVGRYAVQLAVRTAAEVFAGVRLHDAPYVPALTPDHIVDLQAPRFEDKVKDVDAVIDTVGGQTLDRSFDVLKPGGIVVSSVAEPDRENAARHDVRGIFFLVAVTSQGLAEIAKLFDSGDLATDVGEVMPLAEARSAHEMLAGKPHKRGKIVLTV